MLCDRRARHVVLSVLQELVVDVIKEELGNKAGMGKQETNDWVIRKTVGGPLR